MKLKTTLATLLLALFTISALYIPALADEGMWTFNNVPRAEIKKKYGFEVTDEWLNKVRLASVRFNNGGSGSFVSPDGLIVTNHHIGAGSIQKVSPKAKDYLRDGYLARTHKQELKCPDLELNVLQEIVVVTREVNAAVEAPEVEGQLLPPHLLSSRSG